MDSFSFLQKDLTNMYAMICQEECVEFYKDVKEAKAVAVLCDPMRLTYLMKWCEPQHAIELKASLAAMDAALTGSTKVVNVMTCAQSLARPLKEGETRAALAARCKSVVKDSVPAAWNEFLLKVAGARATS